MRWQWRCLRNAFIGVLPLHVQQKARQAKRRWFPHRLELDLWAMEQGLRQVAMVKQAGAGPAAKDVLEIGTGWSPVIPLVFYFAGARSVTLVDRQRLLDDHTFQETCRQLIPHAGTIASRLGVDGHRVHRVLQRLATLPSREAFQELGFSYLAPCDVLDGTLPEGGFDIIISRAVLEHIPPRVLQGIFIGAVRLLRSGGVMCHIIDNSDHWEHGDKRISRLNFLRFPNAVFGAISAMNPLDYQNRLRHPEYLGMMRDSGFEILLDRSTPDLQALSDLARLKVARRFRAMADYDLAILSSFVVARRAASASGGALVPDESASGARRLAG